MKREETLFEPSYQFMKDRGYKITKNSQFNKFKGPIVIFIAHRDFTEVFNVIDIESGDGYDYFDPLTEKDIIKIEEKEKDRIREEVKYCESLTEETRTEDDYSDYWIEKILSLKKYL